jgi:hypothetical protein
MRWKLLFFFFIVILLLSLAYFRFYPSFNFPSITGFFYKVLSSNKPSDFRLHLDFIYEGSFVLLNKTFYANGTCLTPITIGKVSIQKTSMPCKIELYSPNGNIKINGRNIYLEASSPIIKIDNVEYISNEKISLGMNVDSLSVGVFSQNLKIKNLKGKLEKLTNAQVSTTINFPPCTDIELLDFEGEIRIYNYTFNYTLIEGNARIFYWCENVKNKI